MLFGAQFCEKENIFEHVWILGYLNRILVGNFQSCYLKPAVVEGRLPLASFDKFIGEHFWAPGLCF